MIDTSLENKNRQDLDQFDDIWLFGYGSLIYKVDFPYLEKCEASIKGWQRRFWQGSHDHRGTPENPGRVVTLVKVDSVGQLVSDSMRTAGSQSIPSNSSEQVCVGIAYRVAPEVFVHLDHREKNGYLRHQITVELANGDSKQGLIYIADEANQAYLGAAPVNAIAKQILESRGPSGENKDYLLDLASSLRDLRVTDDHVFDVESCLKTLLAS